jgi:3D-(3,5/4)-trihydroxycyclohexane-1,2-dione acylhydrolase (decyclizing)
MANTTVSTALIEGLIAQGVLKFFVVLGHGTTDLGEALRKASAENKVTVIPCRNEIEASHAATALRWTTGEGAAVVTSIGPGALQAVSASLVGASNSVGIWYIFGDETTHDEGSNMQQIPGRGQSTYFKMFSQMNETYLLHTPEAIYSALNIGALTTNHPFNPKPFFLLLPINVQPKVLKEFNKSRLHTGNISPIGCANESAIDDVIEILNKSKKIVIKIGRGAVGAGKELIQLADLLDGILVISPSSLGIVPSTSPRNMGIGGSKGSISGNFAMENAELLLAVGTRAVCQSDCSRTGYPNVSQVVNLNADISDAHHYNNTTALTGDIKETLITLINKLKARQIQLFDSDWRSSCVESKERWIDFRNSVISIESIFDENWNKKVLTQPVVIAETLNWIAQNGYKAFFDAGDVQANGFQLAEVESEGWYYTDSGSSYMGFASSALISGGVANSPFYGVAVTGDGSFMMNPQILIDSVHTKTQGCIVLLDNRRMGAISSLQLNQYKIDFATRDLVAVDYVAMANSVKGVQGLFGGESISQLREAFSKAKSFEGLSLIHIPVYFGEDFSGGMGSYGRWNVGPWVEEVETLISKGVL